TIKADRNCPTCDVALELQYQQEGIPFYKTVTSLKVKLEGTYDPDDKKLIQELGIDFEKKLPKHMALLHFTKRNDIFHLIGLSNGRIQVSCDSKNWETISLARLLERRDLSHEFDDPESYIGRIRQFSGQIPEKLYKWMNTLSEKYDQ